MSRDGGRRFLPYGRHLIDDDDIRAVAEVLRGDWLTTGPAVGAFERALAEATGARHVAVVNSGTAALHAAMGALGIGPGDTVVVPAITFLATATAARWCGAEVRFADVDPDNGLMRAADLEAALATEDKRPALAVPVHLAGQVADSDGIARVAAREGIAVLEDACHALGTAWRDGDGAARRVGDCARSRAAVFSFHPVKAIAAGEGGAVATNDEAVRRAVERMRNHGMTRDAAEFGMGDAFDTAGAPNPWHYEMHEVGLNYRLSDIHAALGLSQLAKLDRFVATRRALAARYDALLAPLAPAVRPVKRVRDCDPAWHVYPVLIDFDGIGLARSRLMRALAERGIGTQVHYIPVADQPYFAARYGRADLPGARAYFRRTLSLPLSAGMTEADVERVVAAVGETMGGCS